MNIYQSSIPDSAFQPGVLHPLWFSLLRDAFMGVVPPAQGLPGKGAVTFIPRLLPSGEVFCRTGGGLFSAIRSNNDAPFILCRWLNSKRGAPKFHLYTVIAKPSIRQHWWEWEGGPQFEGMTYTYELSRYTVQEEEQLFYLLNCEEGPDVLPWETLELE